MKTLFLFRDCYDARYLLDKLEKENLVQAVILESGKDAKIRKLKNLFKNTFFLKYPFVILDICALLLYSFFTQSGVIKQLGKAEYPKNKIKLTVDDANEEKCLQFIKKYRPDIIFIYGTAILKKEFIKKVNTLILNIHAGILPYYRNVHGDFWSYNKKDYKNMGVSIFYLNSGIDTGEIALQKRIQFEENNSLIDAKVKNLVIIPNLIKLAISKYLRGRLKKIKQNNSKAYYYPTPTFKNIMQCFLKQKVSLVSR